MNITITITTTTENLERIIRLILESYEKSFPQLLSASEGRPFVERFNLLQREYFFYYGRLSGLNLFLLQVQVYDEVSFIGASIDKLSACYDHYLGLISKPNSEAV